MTFPVALLALALFSFALAEGPESRIVGGTPTTIYEYPYMVSIHNTDPDSDVEVQRCVGALISSWHVLTAANCFDDANIANAKVRAGSTKSLSGGTVVAIREVIIHPDYLQQPRTADIAIIVLDHPLAISDNVNIVFLPPQELFIPDGYDGKAISWGVESDDDDLQTKALKVINTKTIAQEKCKAAYTDDDNISIYDQVICVTSEDRSMCSGDSGAPLVISSMLAGVWSYSGACDDSVPDIFARVDRHTGWILEHAVPPPPAHKMAANVATVTVSPTVI